MIQQKVFDVQFFCQFTCIFYRRMMLFIGLKNVALGIKTKRLMEQPFTVLRILFFTICIGFISAACKLLSVSHIHAETVLFCFC